MPHDDGYGAVLVRLAAVDGPAGEADLADRPEDWYRLEAPVTLRRRLGEIGPADDDDD